MFKIKKKPGKEAPVPQMEFSRYGPGGTPSQAQLLEDMRRFAEKRPYVFSSMVESDLVKELREEALRKRKENSGGEGIRITAEETGREAREYEEKHPDGPKPYFDRETLEEMSAERERKWARQDLFRKIRLAVGIPLAAIAAFWLVTSTIGGLLLPRVVTRPAMDLKSGILLETRYKDDPQIDVLKARRETRHELEKEDIDWKRVNELRAIEGLEEQKVNMRLREKYKDVKLGEVRQRSLARFPKTSVLRDFYAENPNVDDLTVSEFYASASGDQKRKLHNLLLEFARHAGKE